MWEIRIKQYFQIQDYALWEVIEYGNSWVPIPITAPESGPSTALKMTVPSTTEEKICKKEWIVQSRTRFVEMMLQEDTNGIIEASKDLIVKFLRSLHSEWDTYVDVWMNKPDFETMGLDDLYNNFKIVEQKVKRTVAANNDDKNLAFLTTTSTSSTNSINTGKNLVLVMATPKRDRSKVEYGIVEHEGKDVLQRTGIEDNLSMEIVLLDYDKSREIVSTVTKWDILLENVEFQEAKTIEVGIKGTPQRLGALNYEAQVVKYKESEVLFSEEIALLKRSVGHKDYLMGLVKTELEKVKEEKEGVEFKLAKFEKSSKDLDDLLASQVTDKSKKGFGYNAVPSPHPLILNRPTPLDLSYSGLEEFQQPEINWYGPRDSSSKPTNVCNRESNNSKENIDDSLTQQPKSVTESSTAVPTLRAVLMKTDLKTVKNAKPLSTVRSVNTARPVSTTRCVNTVRPHNNASPKTNSGLVLGQGIIFKFKHKRPFFKEYSINNTDPRSVMAWVPQVRLKGNHVWKLSSPFRFKEFDGGYVTFGGGANGGRITGKGTIKTNNLDFEDVYFVKELKFNLFSVSQMCDKKNYVLFTDSECLVLSPNFKMPDESQILLKIPRQNNMYSFDMKNIVPKDGLTCLVAKATSEESMLWHRRLGHVNFKNINKLVKENLVRDLPLKRFENDQTCVACLKGKQHRASCKTKAFSPTTKPLFMLHMDLFGPTFTKDETSEIIKKLYKEIEKPSGQESYDNQKVHKKFLSQDNIINMNQDCFIMPIWKDASYFEDASLKSVVMNKF
ncbi:putative ribonuclease H-like domain-containing protein [Tanacetum coccineum]|uniref:Ribonuclease H-like domain-containing protein n=1 Tax=Tanacetum coccineum TaxID=301880 RepID=A0ABQ5EXZ6_9ASTR